jgi:hypothetical protein
MQHRDNTRPLRSRRVLKRLELELMYVLMRKKRKRRKRRAKMKDLLRNN